MKSESNEFKADDYRWEVIQLKDENPVNEHLKKDSNSINELFNEFETPPPPVTPPTPEPGIGTPGNETPPTPGAEKGPEAPNKTVSGANVPLGGSYEGAASDGQKLTAKLIMQGWDTLFAGIGVAVTKKPEKFQLYKAAERDLKALHESLAEVMAFYKWNPSPLLPLAIGFTGVYGAKSFEIFQDYNSKTETADDIDSKIEKLRKEMELNELASKVHNKKPETTSTGRGTKPGTKRGPYNKSKK